MMIRPPSLRYIPACAGEASAKMALARRLAVHPRVCGGSRPQQPPPGDYSGTSPRVRGKPRNRPPGRLAPGYIPACAGEAAQDHRRREANRVHPRVCGGSARFDPSRAPGLGTSPRVRGKLIRETEDSIGRRYIPACAGEAWRMTNDRRARRVHPRVCGGSKGLGGRESVEEGTSPRVRGKRRDHEGPRGDNRYIPACAGEAVSTWDSGMLRRVHPRVCGGSPWDISP